MIVADMLAGAIDESFIEVVDSGLPVDHLIAAVAIYGAGSQECVVRTSDNGLQIEALC
jgi:hypothetical protein